MRVTLLILLIFGLIFLPSLPALAQDRHDNHGHAGAHNQAAPPSKPGVKTPEPNISTPDSGIFEGYGVVKSLSLDNLTLEISHDPIPALGWDAMTMNFPVLEVSLFEGVKVGDKVRFDLEAELTKDGSGSAYYIVDLEVQ
jgi:Cu/Ag efflux protein CusF